MADNRLPPMEEARIRTAALVAAQRMSWDVPRHVLDYIVATSDPRQGPAALEMRAAGIVEYVKNHPDRPDFGNATDRQVQGLLQTIHGQVVHLFGGLPYVLASREEEASGSETSARFDAIYTGSDWNSPAGQAQMRNYARQCGLGWAADHPDLMRLGPAAIHALRDANFRRESFRHLRDAGFEGREAARVAVGISRYAVHHGLDANRIAEETARGVEVFGGNSPEARALWRDRFTRFFANPDDAQAREEMDRGLTEMETSGTPQQREHIERLRPLLRLERQATAELRADTDTARAETAEDRAAREAREGEARTREVERAREAADRAAREARERAEAAAMAQAAALMGEDTPTKGPATNVQEGPATKGPAVQEGPPSKLAEARPPRLTAAPGS